MDNIKTIEGDLQCRELRFAIVAARFNDFIVEQLIRGAVDALKRHGAADKQIEIVRAPGAYDLPLVARKLAQSRKYDTGVPVAFGVLTTDTIEQAIERSGTKAGNKGADAAITAIELANLLRRIES
jgi:6,7-dimethyl-8-ribityllumazine synthase